MFLLPKENLQNKLSKKKSKRYLWAVIFPINWIKGRILEQISRMFFKKRGLTK
jgi:hypothetical protein